MLEGFHMEAARRLPGMQTKKRGNIWLYPKLELVLEAARLKIAGEYIAKLQQTEVALVVHRPVFEKCRRGIWKNDKYSEEWA